MIVKCISALPSTEQAKKLGAHFSPGNQAFGVVPGARYVVFALRTLSGQIWIDVADPDLRPGYLFGAPILLFEIVDARLSTEWEARIDDRGELKLAPQSLHRKFYYDRLFEGLPDIVQDFARVRVRLEQEAGMEPQESKPTN